MPLIPGGAVTVVQGDGGDGGSGGSGGSGIPWTTFTDTGVGAITGGGAASVDSMTYDAGTGLWTMTMATDTPGRVSLPADTARRAVNFGTLIGDDSLDMSQHIVGIRISDFGSSFTSGNRDELGIGAGLFIDDEDGLRWCGPSLVDGTVDDPDVYALRGTTSTFVATANATALTAFSGFGRINNSPDVSSAWLSIVIENLNEGNRIAAHGSLVPQGTVDNDLVAPGVFAGARAAQYEFGLCLHMRSTGTLTTASEERSAKIEYCLIEIPEL